MANYEIPFRPVNFIKSSASTKTGKEASVRQNLELMLNTKQPEECNALSNYGTPIKGLHFLLPPRKNEHRWRTRKVKEIKDALFESIKKYEPRLHDTKIELVMYDAIKEADRAKKSHTSLDNLPRGYVLEVRIIGMILTQKGRTPFELQKSILLA